MMTAEQQASWEACKTPPEQACWNVLRSLWCGEARFAYCQDIVDAAVAREAAKR